MSYPSKNIDIKKHQLVTENDIADGGFVYDPDNSDAPVSLSDPVYILDSVTQILEYMVTPEMISLRNATPQLFEELMEEKFSDFSSKYCELFSMVISGQDITPLFLMLNAIDAVKSGEKSIDAAQKGVEKYLNKFLPPDIVNKMETVNKKSTKRKYK